MNFSRHTHLSRLTSALLVVLFVVVSPASVAAQSSAPPDGNTAPPVNVSGTTQVKAGSLGIGGAASVGAALKLGYTDAECDATTAGSIIYEDGALKICSTLSELDQGTSSEYWTGAGQDIYYDIGDVAIGTEEPAAGLRLTVAGRFGATEYCDQLGNNCILHSDLNRTVWTVDGNNLYYTAGNVGIGTTEPTNTLTIAVDEADDVVPLSITNEDTGTNSVGFQLANDTASTLFESVRTSGSGADFVLSTTRSDGTLVERMRLTAAGLFGIGDTTPDNDFDVEGAIGAIEYCNESGSFCVDADSLGDGFWAANGSAIYFNTGNVGVGTTTPAQSIHTTGNFRTDTRHIYFGTQDLYSDPTTGLYYDSGSASGAGFYLRDVNNNFLGGLFGQTSGTIGILDANQEYTILANTDNYVRFRVGGSQVADITANGVAIATTTLATGSELTVNGQVAAVEYCDENGANCFSAESGLGADDMGNHTASTTLVLNDNWLSNDGDSEGIRISDEGSVGIGTGDIAWPDTFPAIQFPAAAIYGRDNGTSQFFGLTSNAYYDGSSTKRNITGTASRLVLDGNEVGIDIAGSGAADSAIAWTRVLDIDSSGNLGINDSSPSQKIEVGGNISLSAGRHLYFGSQDLYGDDGNVLYFDSNNDTVAQFMLRSSDNNNVGGIFGSDTGYFDLRDTGNNWLMRHYTGASTRFAIGGTEYMRLTTTGLGIGTISTDAQLHVVNASETNILKLEATSADDMSIMEFSALRGNGLERTAHLGLDASSNWFGILMQDTGGAGFPSSDPQFVVTTSGNVGIGTTTPVTELNVAGDVGAQQYCDVDGNNCYAITDLVSSGADNMGNHTASTTLVLNDNWISNDGDAEGIRINNNGNVGLGTATPGAALEVAGSVWASQDIRLTDDSYDLQFRNSAVRIGRDNNDIEFGAYSNFRFNNTNSGGEVMRITNTGNVGIGDTSPSQKLEVGGNISMSAGRHLYFNNQDLYGDADSALYFDSNSATTAQFQLRDSGNTRLGTLYGTDDGNFGLLDADGGWIMQHDTDVFTGWRINNSEQMRLTTTGLGIGETSPSGELHVTAADIGPTFRLERDETDTQLGIGATIASIEMAQTDANGPGVSAEIRGIIEGGAGQGALSFFTGAPGSLIQSMRITSTGNIGIGTTTPATELAVAGDVSAVQYCDENGANCTAAGDLGGGLWTATGSDIYYNSGNVGIGTTSPDAGLVVNGTGQSTAAMNVDSGNLGASIVLSDNRVAGASGSGGSVIFGGTGSGGNLGRFAAIKGLLTNSTNNSVGDLAFATRNATTDSTLTERMRITSTGNVGIGTILPSGKLHVLTGTSIVTPNTNADELVIEKGSGNGGMTIGTSNTAQGLLYFGDSDSSAVGGFVYDHASDYLATRVNGSERMRISSAGNVGIGDTDPTEKLSVAGNIESTAGRRIYLGSQTLYGDDGEVLYFDSNDADSARFLMRDSGDTNLGALYGTDSGSFGLLDADGNWLMQHVNDNYTLWNINNAEQMRLTTTGLGIGHTATARLSASVTQDNFIFDLENGSESNFRLRTYNNGTGEAQTASAFNTGLYYGTSENASIHFYRGGSTIGGFLTFTTNNGSERMRITSAGNVGIGTTTPATELAVAGDIGAERYCDVDGNNCIEAGSVGNDNMGNHTASTTLVLNDNWLSNDGDSEGIRIDDSGQVGIGTATPQSQFTISSTTGPFITLRTQDGFLGTGDTLGGINFYKTDGAGITSAIEAISSNNGLYSYLTFSTDTGSLAQERMRLDRTGNLGIGDTDPSQKLEVGGNISMSAGRHLYFGSSHVYGSDSTTLYYDSNSATDARIQLRDSGNTNLGALYGSDSGTFGLLDASGNWGIQIDNGTDIDFRVGGTEEMTLTANGLEVQDKIIVGREGIAGNYDSAEVQGIWSIGDAYAIDTVNDDFGSLYGMGYAFNQNGGAPLTAHQITFVQNGTINAAIGLNGDARFTGDVGAARFCDENGANCVDAANLGDNLGDHIATENIQLDGNWLSGDGGNEGVFVSAAGNVGVGLSNPSVAFHVNSAARVDGGDGIDVRRGITGGYNTSSGTGNDWGANIWSIGNSWSGSGYGSAFTLAGSQYGLSWLRSTHASALGSSEGLYIYDAGNTLAHFGDNLSYIANNTGIGDTTPSQKLEVGGNISMSSGRHLFFGSQDLYGDNGDVLYFDANHSTASQFALRDSDDDLYGSLYGAQGDYIGLLDGDNQWAIQHYKDNYSRWLINNSEQMRLTTTGLGIGTTEPNAGLHVVTTGANDVIARLANTTSLASGELTGVRIQGANDSGANRYVDWFIAPEDGRYGFGYGGSGATLPISSGIANADIVIDDGNVGIGTTTPPTLLSVAGDVSAQQYCDEDGANCLPITSMGGSLWTASSSDIYYNTGNVSIGDTVPSGALMLDVAGQVGAPLYCDEDGLNCFDPADIAAASSSGGVTGGSGTTNYVTKWTASGVLGNSTMFDNGNVGIGDTSPSQKLEVGGNISMASGRHLYFGSQDLYGDDNSTLYFDSNNSSVTQFAMRTSDNVVRGRVYGNASNQFGLLDSDGNWIMQHSTDNYSRWLIDTNEQMRLTTTGLGIGTTAPGAKLAVQGAASDTELLTVNGSNGAWRARVLLQSAGTGAGLFEMRSGVGAETVNISSDGTTYFTGGNVGIGTTTPPTLLSVAGDVSAQQYCDEDGANCTAAGDMGGDNMGNHTASTTLVMNDNWISNDGGNEGIRIDDSGQVGIGTTPTALLHVASTSREAIDLLTLEGSDLLVPVKFSQERPGTNRVRGKMLLQGSGNNTGAVGGVIEANAIQPPSTSGVFLQFNVTQAGGVPISGDLYEFNKNGVTMVTIDNDGDLGIGDTTPGQKLSVAGNIESTAGRHLYFGSQDLYGDNSQTLYFDSNSASVARFLMRDAGDTDLGSLYGTDAGLFGLLDADGNWGVQIDTDSSIGFRVNDNERARVTTNGLEVDGGNVANTDITDSSNYPLKVMSGEWAANQVTGIEFWNGTTKVVPTTRIVSQMAGNGSGGENLYFQTQPSSGTNPNPNQPTTKMSILADGEVGIGDTSPDASLLLDVEGQIGATEYCDENGANCSAITDLGGQWTATGSDIYYESGNVGIGDIDASDLSGDNSLLYVSNDSGGFGSQIVVERDDQFVTNGDFIGSLEFRSTDNNGLQKSGIKVTGETNGNHNLFLYSGNNFTDPSVTLDAYGDVWFTRGDVGIGTSTTPERLTVAGNISMSAGRHLFFGSQDLYGDDANALYFDSNDAAVSQLVLRDSGNVNKGALYGNDSNFGLLDADGNWAIRHQGDALTAWLINDTEYMRLTTTGLGIGTTTPVTALTVNGDVSAAQYCDANGANCIAAGDLGDDLWTLSGDEIEVQNSYELDIDTHVAIGPDAGNVGDNTVLAIGDNAPGGSLDSNTYQTYMNTTYGSTALTGNRNQYGNYARLTNNVSTSGTSGERSSVYGTYYDIRTTGDSYAHLNLGGYFQAQTTSSAGAGTLRGIQSTANFQGGGSVGTVEGGYFTAMGNSSNTTGPGTSMTTLRGIYTSAVAYQTDVSNAYGLESYVQTVNGDQGSIGTAYGVRSRVNADSDDGGAITNGYGGYFQAFGRDTGPLMSNAYGVYASATDATNAYAIRGIANGTRPTNNYGLHVAATGATNNWSIYATDGDAYFADSVGIGDTTPAEKLEVAGNILMSTGRHLFFGSQDLYGDDGQILYFDSNNATSARFLMRDSGDTGLGSLYGTDAGLFGLLDADGNWAIKHTNDTDTQWLINNTEVMRMTTAGLGIGATSLSGTLALDVEGQIGATEYCDNAGANCYAITDLGGQWTVNGSDVYRASGNVGIGTSTPTEALYVDGDIAFNNLQHIDGAGSMLVSAGADTDNVQFRDVSNDTVAQINYATTDRLSLGGIGNGADVNLIFTANDNAGSARNGWVGFDPDDNFVYFKNGGIKGLGLDSTGNVGIGDTDPSNKLSVAGSISMSTGRHLFFGSQDLYGDDDQYLYFDSNHANNARFQLRDAGNTNLGGLLGTDAGLFGLLDADGNWLMQHSTDSYSRWLINNDEQMRLTTTGLGIGVTSVGARLQVLTDDDTWNMVFNNTGTGGSNWWMGPSADSWSSGGGLFLIGPSSNSSNAAIAISTSSTVGIGDLSPDGTLKLDVEGQIGATEYCDENGANCTAAGDLGSGLWSANGSDVYYAAGNVAVGTSTTPEALLHITGTEDTTNWTDGPLVQLSNMSEDMPAVIKIGNARTAGGAISYGGIIYSQTNLSDGKLIFSGDIDSANNEHFTIQSDGTIGFGMWSINDDGIAYTNSTTAQDITIENTQNRDIYFKTFGSNRMVIDNGGNIGIGDMTPAEMLEVGGNISMSAGRNLYFGSQSIYGDDGSILYYDSNSATDARIQLRDSGNTNLGALYGTDAGYISLLDADGSYAILHDTDTFTQWRINNSELMRLTTTGLGIGTTAASDLHVYASDTGVGAANGLTIEQASTGDAIAQFLLSGAQRWVMGTDNSDGDKFKIAGSADLNTDAYMTIDTSGNVGIGVTAPGEKLEVNGRVEATGFVQTSDQKYKTNIATIANARDILGLRGVTFNWREDGRADYGFIAQEVEQLFPELVATNPHTGDKSVSYTNLTPILLELVKEQQAEIDAQAQAIDDLAARLDALEQTQ